MFLTLITILLFLWENNIISAQTRGNDAEAVVGDREESLKRISRLVLPQRPCERQSYLVVKKCFGRHSNHYIQVVQVLYNSIIIL